LYARAGLKDLTFKFDAESKLLQGKNASSVLQALDEVLLKGFQLPELSLSWLALRCGENIKNIHISEGFGVIRPIEFKLLLSICISMSQLLLLFEVE